MELHEIGVNTHSQNKKVFKSTMTGQNITVDDMEKAEKVIIGIKKKYTKKKLHILVGSSVGRWRTKSWWRTRPCSHTWAGQTSQVTHSPATTSYTVHKLTGHSGRNHILSELRKNYWISSVNSAARKGITKCVVCRRLAGKTRVQKMADLPNLIDSFWPIETEPKALSSGMVYSLLVWPAEQYI